MFIVVINIGIILEMWSRELITTVPFKTNTVEMYTDCNLLCYNPLPFTPLIVSTD